MRRTAKQLSIIALSLSTLALTGCKTADQTHSDIVDDPTPAEISSTRRDVDITNRITATSDSNMRAMWADWGRFWLFDRPSRLSPEPTR
jgi:hypothetical protein